MYDSPEYNCSYINEDIWSIDYRGYTFFIINNVSFEVENKKTLDYYQIKLNDCKTNMVSLNIFISALKCALSEQENKLYKFTLDFDEVQEKTLMIKLTYSNLFTISTEEFILNCVPRSKKDKNQRMDEIIIDRWKLYLMKQSNYWKKIK